MAALSKAEKFVATLRELGYGVELQPSSLEWAFEQRSTQPFLEWLTANLRRSNALTVEERQAVAHLKKEGKYMQGQALADAVRSIRAQTTEAAQASNEDTAALVEDIACAQERLARLSAQRDLLAAQREATECRAAQLAAKRRAIELQCAEAVERLDVLADERELLLRGIATSAANLGRSHDRCDDTVYLSRMDLDTYFDVRDTYNREMERYFQRQFPAGARGAKAIANDAAGENGRRGNRSAAAWTELDDPSLLLVRGEDADAHAALNAEFARLQGLFVCTESQRLEALLARASANAQLEVALKQQKSRQSGPAFTSVEGASKALADVRGRRRKAEDAVEGRLRSQVGQLLCDLARLHGTAVLTADLDLKIARQAYCAAKQEDAITLLCAQTARDRYLECALAAELDAHRGARHLLAGLVAELRLYQQSTATRQKQLQTLTQRGQRNLEPDEIDPADEWLHALHALLKGGRSSADVALPTWSSVMSEAARLQSRRRKVDSNRRQSMAECERLLRGLASKIDTTRDQLFASAATAEPVMTLPELASIMEAVETATGRVYEEMEAVLEDRRAKQDAANIDPEQTAALRKLWTQFFTAPDDAVAFVDALAQRASAARLASHGGRTSISPS